jgi:hypothetical protein
MSDESQYPEIDTICDRFEQARRSGDDSPIERWLPADDGLRRAVLVELVRVDLQLRLGAGAAARAEEYLDRFPELRSNPDDALRIITAEYQQRRRAEVTLAADAYRDRFPTLANHPGWEAIFARTAPNTPHDTANG